MSSQEQDNGQPTYVRLTAEQRQALAVLAKNENRTLSGEIRNAVDRYIKSSEGRAA
jgi:predicted DNA-binding protein